MKTIAPLVLALVTTSGSTALAHSVHPHGQRLDLDSASSAARALAESAHRARALTRSCSQGASQERRAAGELADLAGAAWRLHRRLQHPHRDSRELGHHLAELVESHQQALRATSLLNARRGLSVELRRIDRHMDRILSSTGAGGGLDCARGHSADPARSWHAHRDGRSDDTRESMLIDRRHRY